MHLIIDANYLFHRSRHALKDVSLSNEFIRTEIIYGFLKTLLYFSKRFIADEWTFVWDSSIPWREEEYPPYKRERNRTKAQNYYEMSQEDVEIYKIQFAQLKMLKWKILPGLGFINSFKQTGAEGDDLIAMITKSYPDKDFLILATDKDLYQLLTHNVSILNGHTEKIITKSNLIRKYGITPEQWGMAKCIGGCTTDEVKGITGCADPGRSEVSKAIKYLKGELTKGKIFDRIRSKEGQEIIERNKNLILLPHKNTKKIKLEQHSLFVKDFQKMFEKMEFYSFLKHSNFREWEYTFNLI